MAAVCLVAGCRAAPSTGAKPAAAASANTWATVDGKEITRDDVEKAYRRTRDASSTSSEEEALTAKLSLLNDLIVEEILLAKARTLNVDVPANELDAAYENARKNMSDAAFQQQLIERNVSAADMREGLRRELLTRKVIQQQAGSKITVSDQDVVAFFNGNLAQFNVAEDSYHIAQIVVTPVRDAQLANRTGDDATTPAAAATKVQMLTERLKAGVSFGDPAMGYSEDPESAPRGGDLGFVPVSRLKQLPAPLREAVLNKPPGSVSVVPAGGGYTIVLVVAHEPPGQRDLSTPGVRDRIAETLRGRREQLLRAAYLTTIRDEAAIVNYLARRLVESNGQAPGVKPVLPTAR